MKSVIAKTMFATVLFATFATGSAYAQTDLAVNDRVPLTFAIVNPCALDESLATGVLPPIVVMEGELHLTGNIDLTQGRGRLHYNASGIGSEFALLIDPLAPSITPTGRHYQITGSGNVMAFVDTDDLSTQDKARIKLQLVSATSEDNFSVTIRAFVKVDPLTGNVTLQDPVIEAECKG